MFILKKAVSSSEPPVTVTKSTHKTTVSSSEPSVTVTKSTHKKVVSSSEPSVTVTKSTHKKAVSSSEPSVAVTKSTHKKAGSFQAKVTTFTILTRCYIQITLQCTSITHKSLNCFYVVPQVL
jgi:hypothetical protein